MQINRALIARLLSLRKHVTYCLYIYIRGLLLIGIILGKIVMIP